MNRDLVYSLLMHGVIVAVVLFASPLQFRKVQPFGEVIRVHAVSLGDIEPAKGEPEPLPPTAPPKPAIEPEEEIPVTEPTTKPAVAIDKPTQKPAEKPKTPPKQTKPAEKPSETKPSEQHPGNTGTPEGSGEVEAPAGGAISGVRIDNAAFDHPYWFDLAWNKINQNYRFAITIDGKVYCDVYFVVIKSGRVVETKIVNSSGIPAFDQACVAAIERSSPFPPLPRDWLDEILGITITFTNSY